MLIQISEINLILVVRNRTRNVKILLKININIESITSLNLVSQDFSARTYFAYVNL